MNKSVVLTVLLPIILVSCEAAPNAYPNGPGFYETKIEDDRYRIVYRAARGMPQDRVEDFALLRAADMTLGNGYNWFRIVNRQAAVDGPNGPVISLGTGSTNFGRRSAVGVGIGTSFQVGGGPAQVLTLEIQMGKGAKPDERATYDATDVAQTIRSRL